MTVEYLSDYKGDWQAVIAIKCPKKVKHPADNLEAITKALSALGYEVTSLKFSTPDFMNAIEQQPNEKPKA